MSILCAIFGHKSNHGIHSGAEYMTLKARGVDGINRHHYATFSECPRCHVEYKSGMIHIPQEYITNFKE